MNRKTLRYGEFVIVLKDDIATVYDLRTRSKIFRGEIDRVFSEVREKVEGSFSLDYGFKDKHKKKKEGWSWEF